MGEWQPIETAPKAGVVILVFDPKFGRCTASNDYGVKSYILDPWSDSWHVTLEWDGRYENDTESFKPCDCGWDHEVMELHPTHWMPLPNGPV